MITVMLNGGLGNQMFQYAFGRMLSIKHNTNLILDLSYLNSKLQHNKLATYRPFELNIFNINATTSDIIFKGKYLYPVSKAEHWFKNWLNKTKFYYFQENNSGWDEKMMTIPNNSYIRGFFQTEEYFKQIENILRKELSFNQALSADNLELSYKISSQNSIAVHFRRGDFIRLKKNLSKHGITSLDYYQRAIEEIKTRVENPHFYLFSDDPEWVKNNITIDMSYKVVESNTDSNNAWIDMCLMSKCKHQIICNSTFSWWAAWLNNNPVKIVIAPDQWYADQSLNGSYILPNNWLKL
jgi:hypothetical protein